MKQEAIAGPRIEAHAWEESKKFKDQNTKELYKTSRERERADKLPLIR